MSENKEANKKEVTNEMLLEHLKEIEISQGCIANGINTLFYIIDNRKEELKLSNEEKQMIESGQIAMALLSERMADISGMNKRVKEGMPEIHVVGVDDMENVMKLLMRIAR